MEKIEERFATTNRKKRMRISNSKLLIIISLILIVFGVPSLTKAAGASLYLSPASGTFFVGSTFDVSVFVNTGEENVNAVEVNIKFDPKKIQVASPTTGKSFIEVWIAQPTYSNTKGTMKFIGGVPTPGINTSAGLVSTVTFRAITPGETSVVFLENSKVLRNDPHGTNILTSLGRGSYNLVIPPPEGPEVFSSTHPDQNKWYKNNNPTFSWEKTEGVTDFSYSFDEDPTGVPDNISEGGHNSISFNKVKDGFWYFHVKAKEGEVWGGTSHYLVRIDSTPPAIFKPTVDPSDKTTEKQPLISFITTDALSGLDHYQIKYIDVTPGKEEEGVGFFTEVSSPHKLPSLDIGDYLIIVRAHDKAGNWREGTVKIKIFPEGIYFSSKGIHYLEWFFPWWLLLLILLIILAIILFSYWRKHKGLVEQKKERLKRVEERLGEQHREIKNGFDKYGVETDDEIEQRQDIMEDKGENYE
jgi:hypothetical protein